MTDQVGTMVRRRRDALGLSAQALADACTELGYPMARNSVANLENGRRSEVSVAELVIMAEVLKLPPVELLFGAHLVTGDVEYIPGEIVMAWEAVRRFTGETPAGIRPNPASREYNLSLMRQLDAGAGRYSSLLENHRDLIAGAAERHLRIAGMDSADREHVRAELEMLNSRIDQIQAMLDATKDEEALIRATLADKGFQIDHTDDGGQS